MQRLNLLQCARRAVSSRHADEPQLQRSPPNFNLLRKDVSHLQPFQRFQRHPPLTLPLPMQHLHAAARAALSTKSPPVRTPAPLCHDSPACGACTHRRRVMALGCRARVARNVDWVTPARCAPSALSIAHAMVTRPCDKTARPSWLAQPPYLTVLPMALREPSLTCCDCLVTLRLKCEKSKSLLSFMFLLLHFFNSLQLFY